MEGTKSVTLESYMWELVVEVLRKKGERIHADIGKRATYLNLADYIENKLRKQ